MKEVKGVYTTAKVFSDNVEDKALLQIKMLCNNEAFYNCKVRVMPDVHPGYFGTIGFTSTLGDRILPEVIGPDIGCGVSIAKIDKKNIEFKKLDAVIRDYVPSGFNIRNTVHSNYERYCDILKFRCAKAINFEKAQLSLGTLGGGNHFIEVDKDDEDNLYLVVHTGSRILGEFIFSYYMKEGQMRLKSRGIDIPFELTYLDGELMKDYIHDVETATAYAQINRLTILDEIEKHMKFKEVWYTESIHNNIQCGSSINTNDTIITKGSWPLIDDIIIRKGAISAYNGICTIIPINMKDGIILGTGLGNEDWNYSAPHGAGRIMNRESVKSNFTVNQFKKEMKGIYSSCIRKDTLDEAPFAYRGIDEIKEAISETVKIDKILKPVYNFKAGGKE